MIVLIIFAIIGFSDYAASIMHGEMGRAICLGIIIFIVGALDNLGNGLDHVHNNISGSVIGDASTLIPVIICIFIGDYFADAGFFKGGSITYHLFWKIIEFIVLIGAFTWATIHLTSNIMTGLVGFGMFAFIMMCDDNESSREADYYNARHFFPGSSSQIRHYWNSHHLF